MKSGGSAADSAITEVLSQYPSVQLAILFGSCATGNATPTSDLDLAVLAGGPLDADLQDIVVLNLTRRIQLCVDIASHVIAASTESAPATMGEAIARLADIGVIDDRTATAQRHADAYSRATQVITFLHRWFPTPTKSGSVDQR